MSKKIKIYLVVFCFFIIANIDAQPVKNWPDYTLRGVNTRTITDIFKFQKDSMAVLNKKYFEFFNELNVNLIRVLIRLDPQYLTERVFNDVPSARDSNFVKYYKENLMLMKKVLDLAEENDIYVIISTNRDIRGGKSGVFYNPHFQTGSYFELLNIWTYIAEKFGHYSNLIAYDPMSEPRRGIEQEIWQDELFEKFTKKIRKIDKETFILYAPGPNGRVDGYEDLNPFDLEKIVYSLHFYYPHGYTNQGILGFVKNQKGDVFYPGLTKTRYNSEIEYWYKDKLEEVLWIFTNFGKKYNQELFLGEFAVVRWAPNAAKWVDDVISLFEKYDLGWSYHAFGGWNGFNPTFGKDAEINSRTLWGENTKRLQILKSYWEKNTRSK